LPVSCALVPLPLPAVLTAGARCSEAAAPAAAPAAARCRSTHLCPLSLHLTPSIRNPPYPSVPLHPPPSPYRLRSALRGNAFDRCGARPPSRRRRQLAARPLSLSLERRS
jgi:hypothetical protein